MPPPGLDAMHHRCPRSPRQSYGSETGFILRGECNCNHGLGREQRLFSVRPTSTRVGLPVNEAATRWHKGEAPPDLDDRVGTRPWLAAARTVEHARSPADGYLMLARRAFKS